MTTSVMLRDFDSVAADWDQQPRRVQLARAVADRIISEAQPVPTMRALDFGCGTGLVTLALAPLVREILAADSSSGMLEQLSGKLSNSGIVNIQPLLISHDGSFDLHKRLDLVVSSMTMHHIGDVAGLIKRFHAILAPGGQLCIADLETEDGNFHDDPTGIQHNGFSIAEMQRFFSEAGFSKIRSVRVMEIQKPRDGYIQGYPVNLTIGCRED